MLLLLLATMIVLILETALATFVAARAWESRAARLFLPFAASLASLNMLELARSTLAEPAAIYATRAIATLNLAVLQVVLLLFFSALFAPTWWEGRRDIRWIVLPYLLACVALAIDLSGGFGLFVNGLAEVEGGYRLNPGPGGPIMLALFIAGWLVLLALLGAAFARDPRSRPAISLLFLSIVLSSALGLLVGRIPALDRISGLIQSLAVIGALAYTVLRTQLLAPTRAALELALYAINEPVAVLDREGLVVYANPAASAVGLRLSLAAEPVLRAHGVEAASLAALLDPSGDATQTLEIGGRRIEFSSAQVADRRNRVLGLLLLGRDITEVARYTGQLEAERARLAEAVRDLEKGRRERVELSATIRGLSLPVIPVLDGVLVLPLIGAFDGDRLEALATTLLAGVERARARLVLIDLTGLPLMDQTAAAGLLRVVRAAALLGARCVLVGVRPEIAESLVGLGVPLDGLATAATLRQVLTDELRVAGRG
jgi:rsbT co-antagonist protein RsbR